MGSEFLVPGSLERQREDALHCSYCIRLWFVGYKIEQTETRYASLHMSIVSATRWLV